MQIPVLIVFALLQFLSGFMVNKGKKCPFRGKIVIQCKYLSPFSSFTFVTNVILPKVIDYQLFHKIVLG